MEMKNWIVLILTLIVGTSLFSMSCIQARADKDSFQMSDNRAFAISISKLLLIHRDEMELSFPVQVKLKKGDEKDTHTADVAFQAQVESTIVFRPNPKRATGLAFEIDPKLLPKKDAIQFNAANEKELMSPLWDIVRNGVCSLSPETVQGGNDEEKWTRPQFGIKGLSSEEQPWATGQLLATLKLESYWKDEFLEKDGNMIPKRVTSFKILEGRIGYIYSGFLGSSFSNLSAVTDQKQDEYIQNKGARYLTCPEK